MGFHLNSSLTQNSFNNTMTNINKNASGRSITPTNLSKGTSKDFLNRSLNMKNQNNGNRFSETNVSFSASINNLNKTGGFSKSPLVYKDLENKPKTSIRVSKDISFDRNLSANKSFDRSKEGFYPKSTLRIVNNKSPMSSRSNIKKSGNNVSISTNASPIYKNISITNTSKGPIENSIIKNFNDFKNKNASPVIYSSLIKKIQKSGNNNIYKKIPTPNQMHQNMSAYNNANSLNMNNTPGWNNINNNPIKKSNNPSNINSNDLSTNITSGLNSNNNPNCNLGNMKNSSGNTISNDGDCFFQIQPKYENDNKNNLNNQKMNQPLNNYNNGNQQQNQNQINPSKNRENKFLNNNNNENLDFKTMNTSPLLRVR